MTITLSPIDSVFLSFFPKSRFQVKLLDAKLLLTPVFLIISFVAAKHQPNVNV